MRQINSNLMIPQQRRKIKMRAEVIIVIIISELGWSRPKPEWLYLPVRRIQHITVQSPSGNDVVLYQGFEVW